VEGCVNIRTLAYIGLEVSDIDAWRSFAERLLGMPDERVGDDSNRLLLRMDQQRYRFDLRAAESDRLAWLGWEVATGNDLEEAERELVAAGVEVRRGTVDAASERGVRGFIWFQDPAGNRQEISFGPEADLRPIVMKRAMSGYVTGELGLGHAVLGVQNLTECLEFYTRILGLRMTDTYRDFIAFLHCNARHHSLALVGTDKEGLRHIMLETRELDDVGMALDVAQADGIVTRTLGRHTNDRAVSFYVETPSGWEIEYGWGGLQVDPSGWRVRQIAGPTSLWGHEQVGGRIKKATERRAS
jgi:2,3-dihydroxybiphenyl 1,2-dioxygenase